MILAIGNQDLDSIDLGSIQSVSTGFHWRDW